MGNVTLKSNSGKILYPQTTYSAVLDSNGEQLRSDFSKIVEKGEETTTVASQSILNNYYTKSEMYTKTDIDTRSIVTGYFTDNKTYNFSSSGATILYLDGSSSTTEKNFTTHKRPIVVAGKIFASFTNMWNVNLYVQIGNNQYKLLYTNNTSENNYSFFKVINWTSANATYKVKFTIVGTASDTQTMTVTRYDTSDFVIFEL